MPDCLVGAFRSQVALLPWAQGVVSSNLAAPTKFNRNAEWRYHDAAAQNTGIVAWCGLITGLNRSRISWLTPMRYGCNKNQHSNQGHHLRRAGGEHR